MGEARYFWITCSEDGDVFVRRLSKEDVLAAVDDPSVEPEYRPKFLLAQELKDTSDPVCWRQGSGLLIKGEIVVPRVVECVTKHEIE